MWSDFIDNNMYRLCLFVSNMMLPSNLDFCIFTSMEISLELYCVILDVL